MKKTVKFVYENPAGVRDLHVNGAYGSVDQAGNICMALFNERHPTPKSFVQDVNEDGRLVGLSKPEFSGDVVRVLQASVVMDFGTAMALRQWLDTKIKESTDRMKQETEKAEQSTLH